MRCGVLSVIEYEVLLQGLVVLCNGLHSIVMLLHSIVMLLHSIVMLLYSTSAVQCIYSQYISLNAAYGFITKFNIQRGQQTGPIYWKYIVGYITVFPNDVELLAATILPYLLVLALDQVYVIWIGIERPTLRDVSKLLSV